MGVTVIKNKYLELHTTHFGASMQALYVYDRDGRSQNVIFGYKEESSYGGNPFFMGAVCGRYAGRISSHGFTINNEHYPLDSDGEVHLHGGRLTLSFQKWQLQGTEAGDTPSVTYTITSDHLEGGYPGTIRVQAKYTLIKNRVAIEYRAITDRTTHLNLTNHNYYNLNGGGSTDDHEVKITATGRLETDELKVPTGRIIPIKNTPYDLSTRKVLGEVVNQIALDDVFVFDNTKRSAILYAPKTGIGLTLTSNQPGVVIFVPESLGEGPFLNSAPLKFPAICLEPQNFPDAPNIAHFPSSLLKAGEVYTNLISLEFSAD